MKKLLALVFAVFALTLVSLNGVVADSTADNSGIRVWVDGVPITGDTTPLAISPGETVPIRIGFTAARSAEDVKVKVEVLGYADDLEVKSSRFDILNGDFYTKVMGIKFPFDLDDELNNVVKLRVTVYNDDSESSEDFTLDIQREAYNVEVLSIDTDSQVIAGQQLAVDVVLKNRGMRDLEDLFVTARIPALGIERRAYFSDIFALDENDRNSSRHHDDDEEDSVSGRIYLSIPEDAKSGSYPLEVSVRSADVSANAVKEISIENRFSGDNVVVTTTSRTLSVGEDGTYTVLIVNPSSTLKVYNIVPESSSALTVIAEPSVVAVPAGSSKEVELTVRASEEGTHKFGVNVYSNNQLVERSELTASVKSGEIGKTGIKTNPAVALTIVLAVVFIVLLIVLISLLARRPTKTEEFSESYY